MYIKNNIDVICDYFASLIFKDEQTLVSYAGEGFMPNEMRLLSKLDQEKKIKLEQLNKKFISWDNCLRIAE